MSEQDLEELFAQYGTVSSAKIIRDRESGRSKGFGFVELDSSSDGNSAIEELNGREVMGRSLTVNEARPREGGDRPRGNQGNF